MTSATIDRDIDVRPEHLDESQISAFVDRDLSEAERRRIQAHIDQCSSCRAALVDVMRVVDSFGQADARPTPAPLAARNPTPPTRRSRVIIGALTAAGVVAIGFLLPRTDQSPSRERSTINIADRSADTRISIEVVTPLRNDSVSAHALHFRWRSVAGIDLYHVVVLDSSGAPVWSGDAGRASQMSADSLALVPGNAYFWRVDGIRDGVSATSGAVRFLAK